MDDDVDEDAQAEWQTAPVFEAFWQGRLIPGARIDTLPFLEAVRQKRTAQGKVGAGCPLVVCFAPCVVLTAQRREGTLLLCPVALLVSPGHTFLPLPCACRTPSPTSIGGSRRDRRPTISSSGTRCGYDDAKRFVKDRRLRGALFFGPAFRVTRNKLLFRDNLGEALAAAVPGERQMEAKFRQWLQRCHATLDK